MLELAIGIILGCCALGAGAAMRIFNQMGGYPISVERSIHC